MQPDPSNLLAQVGMETPLIGFYDAPDISPFVPLVEPVAGERACVFDFFENWLQGETLHLTRENYGCGGAGYWICRQETRSREDFVSFLVDQEGLKASHELMNKWIDETKPYQMEHSNILIGPLRESQYDHLKTVTFFVNPDQLGLLSIAANYHSAPGDPPPIIAPFGSGCGELVALFEDLNIPQAAIGATDIAMRHAVPPDVLAFTVTRPLFELLCKLDKNSFLYKPFWKKLQKARGLKS